MCNIEIVQREKSYNRQISQERHLGSHGSRAKSSEATKDQVSCKSKEEMNPQWPLCAQQIKSLRLLDTSFSYFRTEVNDETVIGH